MVIKTVFTAFAMFLTNCAPDGPTKDLAAIKVQHQMGTVTSTIKEVDGQTVSPHKQVVTLSPGHHKLAFEYSKVVKTKHGLATLSALNPVDLNGIVTAGKTYHVDASGIVFSRVDVSDTPLMNIATGTNDLYEITGGHALLVIAKE